MKKINYWKGIGKTNTIVLPNGYGYLGYIDGLINSLLKVANNIYVPILPGQNGIKGNLNIKVGSIEINNFISNITSKKNVIICHCSSFILMNEIKNDKFWNKIDKIILYSYLSNPIRHFERYKKKSDIYGVHMNQNEKELLKYNNPSIYSGIPVPIYVIHPKTAMNKVRAKQNDLAELSKNPNIVSIKQPDIGYEIIEDKQCYETSFIVNNFFKELL